MNLLIPSLADSCVVCLHDMATCQYGSSVGEGSFWGNNVLFNSVTAEKYLNFIPENAESSLRKFPNIAAFRVNEETKANILDVFSGLFMPWDCFPGLDYCKRYYDYIHKIYGETLVTVFDGAFKQNLLNYGFLHKKLFVDQQNTVINTNIGILLYGAGFRGRYLYKKFCEVGLQYIVKKWVDQNKRYINGDISLLVDSVDNIGEPSDFDFVIVTPGDSNLVKEICSNLKKVGFSEYQIIIYQSWLGE